MTKEELTSLRNERGKQELNIGDKVSVQYPSGSRLGTICEVKYGGLYDVCYGGDCIGYDIPENLITRAIFPVGGYNVEFSTDEIKVGDRIKFKSLDELKSVKKSRFGGCLRLDEFADKEATVTRVDYNTVIWEYVYEVDITNTRGITRNMFDKLLVKDDKSIETNDISEEDIRRMEDNLQREKEQHLREHISNEDKPKDNTITIPVKADLDDTYWDAYRAELVKELAVKLADNNSITIPKICDYITDFATRIVNNLKKQSE